MSDLDLSFSSSEPDALYSELDGKTWFEIMTENHDELSTAYIDLVGEFATLLKESLRSNHSIQSNLSSALHQINYMRSQLPQIIKTITSSPEVNENPVEPQEKKNIEEVICNLFTRVLEIFTKDNRSVNDLYASMDINKDGKINLEEMRNEFLKYDPSISLEEAQAVFDILDGNKDGCVSLQELTKRMKYIEEKAEMERIDPLACLVISKPLDPECIHGNLSVMLIRSEGFKPGTHAVKIKVPGNLEYLTSDTTSKSHNWNFRADFLFENKTSKELPLLIELELYNKNKIEGTGSMQWKKAMNAPNEFSLKNKVLIKTSTGQDRGVLFFQLQWTPIVVKVYTEEEIEKMNELEKNVNERKKQVEEIEKVKRGQSFPQPDCDDEEIIFSRLSEEKRTPVRRASSIAKGYSYVTKTNQMIVERVIKKKLSNPKVPMQPFDIVIQTKRLSKSRSFSLLSTP